MKRIVIGFFACLLTIVAQAQLAPDYIRHPSGSCTAVKYTSPSSNVATCTPAASGSADGYLTSTDWSTFNGKISAITGGTCTNQFVTALTTAGLPTCTTATLAGAQFANQGTTTTVLHGNATGNPSFANVVAGDFGTQTANTFLGGPASGSAATPSFRALGAADVGLTTKGDLITYSTALARLGVGSNGQALIADSTATNGIKWGSVGGGSGGGLLFVNSAVVAGSAATTLTISGLDLNADQRYFLWVDLLSAAASNAQVSLFYNSDTTATNYDVQSLVVNNTTVTGARGNNAVVYQLTAVAGANGETSFVCWIQNDLQSRPRSTIWGSRDGTTAIVAGGDFHLWRTSGTNVTGITLSSSVASALAIGSRIIVFKLVTS